MRMSRFILNSDYATLKNDSEGTVTLVIPSRQDISANQPNVVYKSSVDVGAKPSAAYRCYVTSSKYNYAVTSSNFYVYAKQDGYANVIPVDIFRENSKFTIQVTFPSFFSEHSSDKTTWTDMGQTLTLHIQSFIDPFNPD